MSYTTSSSPALYAGHFFARVWNEAERKASVIAACLCCAVTVTENRLDCHGRLLSSARFDRSFAAMTANAAQSSLGDPSFSPLFRRSLRSGKIERTVDQSDMTERLREVSNHPLGVRIVLLCQEADVVAK